MSLLQLAPDVLQPIVGLLPATDTLNLARVSHAAHALALPRILAHVTLGGAFHRPVHYLSPNAQLRAFCASVLKNPHRAPLVRSLELRRDAVRRDRTYEIDPDAVRLLSDFLARASGLQSVTLWGFAQLVDAYPSIVHALARCDRLQTVVLGGDVPTIDVLQRAFPHVRTLEFVEGACFAPGTSTTSTVPTAWPSLDRLSTARPPSAPIRARQLTLLDPVRNDEAAIEQALAFIRHARPVVLSVAVDADVPDADFVERLREVCGGDGVAGYDGVRFLELVLSGCRSLARVESWMTHAATHLHALPLAGLALLSSTRATFPTPRPTPAASPLSSPPLGPSSPASPSAVDTLALDADAETPTTETMYGAPRRAPPGVEALARAVRGALPGLRYLGLAPCGPAEGQGKAGAECEWFELGRVGRARCVGRAEAGRVRRRLEGMARWD